MLSTHSVISGQKRAVASAGAVANAVPDFSQTDVQVAPQSVETLIFNLSASFAYCAYACVNDNCALVPEKSIFSKISFEDKPAAVV